MKVYSIPLTLLITILLVANCNGQNKTSRNLAPVNKLTAEKKENGPMSYQVKTLTREERRKIEQILKEEREAGNIELSNYAGQIHRFLFVSYKVKKAFIVLDEDPSAHHYSAIIDTGSGEILPNSKETLARIFQTVDLFNNRELSDKDIVSLISKVLYGGDLLTENFQLFDEAELPVIQRDKKFIQCTAHLRTSDSGMTKPYVVKQTITIDDKFNITYD